MKKRIIALIIAVVMFSQVIPVAALADTNYNVSFKINPSHNAMEADFREWAATLVDFYRGYDYAALNPGTSTSSTVNIHTLERVWGGWEETEELFPFNASVYAPYYKLAKQKQEFDASMDATAQNAFGVVTRYTYYTAADLYEHPDKATEIYEWLLIQTLKEKAELEPGFLTGTDYIREGDKAGWYTFDVETGGMTYDTALDWVDLQSQNKMAESIAHSLVSLAEVAYEGCKIYGEIKGKAADIAEDAVAKLNTTSVDYDKLLEDFKEDMLDSLVETIADAFDETFEQVSQNTRNEIQNIIRTNLAIELANQVLSANKNVIGYLKSAYVNPDTMLDLVKTSSVTHVQGFRDAAEKIITRLESEEARNAVYEEVLTAMKEVTFSMTNMEEVVPPEVIAYNILTMTIHQLVSETCANVQSWLTSMMDEVIKKKAAKGAQDYFKVLKEFVLTDLWNRFVTSGVVDGLKKGFELHKPTEIVTDGALTFAGNLFNDIMDQIGKGMDLENFGDFLLNCVIDRGVEIIVVVVGNVTKDKKTADKTDVEKVIESYSSGAFFSEREQEPTILHLVLIVLGLALADYVSDYTTAATQSTSFLSDVDKDALNNHLSALKKTMGKLSQIKKIDKKAMINQGKALLADIATLIDWAFLANPRYKENLFAALGDSFTNVYANMDFSKVMGEVLDFVQDIIKSGDLWDILLYTIAEYDVEKTQENAELLKAYADANPNDKKLQQNKATAQRVIDATNKDKDTNKAQILATIEDVISGVWEKALDFGSDFWVAVNDSSNAKTGENLASLDAARLYITYKNSHTLESTLKNVTIGGGRTARYQSMGPSGLDFFLNGGAEIDQNGYQSNSSTSLRLNISSAEIRNPDLTPDLYSIKALTDNILMQMELDLIGMGSYVTLLENRDEFRDTRFYKNWLNIGMLTTEYYAEQCMIRIRKGISYGESYDQAWNILFE